MTKTLTFTSLLLIAFFFGCSQKSTDDKMYYRAINGRDTALLSIIVYEKRFFGEFEMIYGKNGKDSGAVRGELVGDTLKGEFKYLSFGGSKSIKPFSVLNKEGTLRLGKGKIGTYMGMPFYVKDSPIDYEIGFVFEEISKP